MNNSSIYETHQTLKILAYELLKSTNREEITLIIQKSQFDILRKNYNEKLSIAAIAYGQFIVEIFSEQWDMGELYHIYQVLDGTKFDSYTVTICQDITVLNDDLMRQIYDVLIYLVDFYESGMNNKHGFTDIYDEKYSTLFDAIEKIKITMINEYIICEMIAAFLSLPRYKITKKIYTRKDEFDAGMVGRFLLKNQKPFFSIKQRVRYLKSMIKKLKGQDFININILYHKYGCFFQIS